MGKLRLIGELVADELVRLAVHAVARLIHAKHPSADEGLKLLELLDAERYTMSRREFMVTCQKLFELQGPGIEGRAAEVGAPASARAQRVPPAADPPGSPTARPGTATRAKKRRRASR